MLVMLVVMLVEGVFLLSEVVKTVFPLTKKFREIFSFFTTNKKDGAARRDKAEDGYRT